MKRVYWVVYRDGQVEGRCWAGSRAAAISMFSLMPARDSHGYTASASTY
ncbi:hypothetical protein bAD24_p00845 (plasmid) [Burkholderia sp. AD24]|nr:hypothetical protein bAD24_p00845 [Burkholderia sp. AD24]